MSGNSRFDRVVGSAGSWLFNIPNSKANPDSWSNPLENLGVYHEAGRWNFAGIALGEMPAGAQGRWFIPGAENVAARYGSFGDFTQSLKTRATTKGMRGKLAFGALKRVGAPLWIGNSLLHGDFKGVALETFGPRLLAPVLRAMFLNPVGAAITTTVALSIAGVAAYVDYRNKLGDFRKKARQTEFVGDMSAFSTNAAVTMRQRSSQAISRSFMNARRGLGQEAQYYHMPKSLSFANNPALYGI